MANFDVSRQSGPALALVAAALFGASTPFAKLLIGDGVDPLLLAALLYCGSGLGLGAVYALRFRIYKEANLQRTDIPMLLTVVLFGGIAAPVLLMFGLVTTSASSASLLLNLEGLAMMAIAWLWFKEYVDRGLLLGAGAILIGAIVLSFQGIGSFGIGALAIAGACVAWSIDNNLTRKISGADPVQIAVIKGVAAGVINLVLAWFQDAPWPSLMTVTTAALIGFVGYGLSVVLFVFALRALGTARTGAYFSTAPFIGASLALLLGEPITIQLIIAAVLMCIGVYLHLTEQHAHEHSHEELEHEHSHVHDVHHQHAHDAGDPPGEPHVHRHRHTALIHSHPHFPDIRHRHTHQ